MITFIQQYGAILMRPIVLICWFLVYKKQSRDSKFTDFSIKMFFAFLLIFIVWNFFALLFSDLQGLDNCAIAFDLFFFEIIKQFPPLTYEFE